MNKVPVLSDADVHESKHLRDKGEVRLVGGMWNFEKMSFRLNLREQAERVRTGNGKFWEGRHHSSTSATRTSLYVLRNP
jgi:hypothetical protein